MPGGKTFAREAGYTAWNLDVLGVPLSTNLRRAVLPSGQAARFSHLLAGQTFNGGIADSKRGISAVMARQTLCVIRDLLHEPLRPELSHPS